MAGGDKKELLIDSCYIVDECHITQSRSPYCILLGTWKIWNRQIYRGKNRLEVSRAGVVNLGEKQLPTANGERTEF
jgi:hypothetical protein